MSQTPELRTDRGPGRAGEPANNGRRDRTIRFIETLGRGGFGAVYLAEVETSEGLVQRLAVKVLSAEMSGHNDIAGRQRDEARLLSRLNHDNIVKVFDLTTVHNRPAVMMEFVDGADAAELVKRGRFSPRAALQVVAATASALHTAFSAPAGRGGQPLRVIHRDIKPANLLVSRHGGVKVLDFGIARGDFDREGKTESVQFGTARYMAPEQWLYAQISHAVDIYALGVTLAELMAGQQLGRAPLSPEKFQQHVDAVLEELITPELPPAAGAELGELLRGMLAFAPEDRFSADQVYERAIGLIDDLPGEGLNRLAARLVPACVEQRKERFRNDPVLDAISVSHETVSPTGSGTQLPPGAPLTPAGFSVPSPAPEPTPAPSPWSGARPPPSDQTRAVLDAETVRAKAPKAQGTLPPPPPVSGPTITPAAGRTATPRTISPASRPAPTPAPVAVPVTPVEAPRPAPRSALLPIAIALGFLLTLGSGAVATFAFVSQSTPTSPAEEAPTAEAPTAEAPPAPTPVEAVAAAPSPTEAPATAPSPAVVADASGSRQKNTSAYKPPPAGSDTEPENTRIVPTSSASPTATAAPPAEAPQPARQEPPPRSTEAPPATAAAAPEAPAAEQVSLKFTSKPLGAEVFLDGRSLGATPRTVRVTVGEHSLRFVSGELSATKSIQVTASTPPHYSWKADTNVISNQQ